MIYIPLDWLFFLEGEKAEHNCAVFWPSGMHMVGPQAVLFVHANKEFDQEFSYMEELLDYFADKNEEMPNWVRLFEFIQYHCALEVRVVSTLFGKPLSGVMNALAEDESYEHHQFFKSCLSGSPFRKGSTL